MKSNPARNTYYWRAIRRIAKKRGISIAQARRTDWIREVNREKKRRSQAHMGVRPGKTTPKKTKILCVSHVRDSRKTTGKPKGSGKTVRTHGKEIRTHGRVPELKIREYDRIPEKWQVVDEPEYDEPEETEEEIEEWERDWSEAYGELNELDDLYEFAEEFDDRDDEKYQEPS